jgi:glucose/arabinose dehydrogenase
MRFFIPFLTFLFFSIQATSAILPPGFIESPIAEGLDPTAMAQTPDGRILIAEKYGAVRVVENGVLLEDPLIVLDVDNYNERGLSGIAVHPDFENNGFLYLYYTVPLAGYNRLVRIKTIGNYADPLSEETLFEFDVLTGTVHNAGAMAFGPDGKLYLATGDGSNFNTAISLSTVMGKVLRLNDDGSIPEDNPFYLQNDGKYRAIWAYGFRNPFSLTIQPGTGRVYVCDVGSEFYEEVNHVEAGKFYGWNVLEGYRTWQDMPDEYRDPVYAYSHSIGCAVVGAAFYNPPTSDFPSEYQNKFFFADYCKNYIKYLDPETGALEGTFATDIPRPLCILTGNDGSLYYISRGGIGGGSETDNTSSGDGTLWKIEYVGDGPPVFSINPHTTLVVEGEDAHFSAQANGSAPLSYFWTKDGNPVSGATGPDLTLNNVMVADSGSLIRCHVSNSFGQVQSQEAVLQVTSNQRPMPLITSPSPDFKYAAGEPIDFAGIATDPETGGMDADALTWRIDLHHDDHTHPGLAATSGIENGTFTLPLIGETAENVWIRILLSATDEANLTRTVHQDIFPDKVDLRVESDPVGIQARVDGKTSPTPYQTTSVRGLRRFVEMPRLAEVDNKMWAFQYWEPNETTIAQSVYPQDPLTVLQAKYVEVFPGNGYGLTATYFDIDDLGNFTTPYFTRIDAKIDFEWHGASPHPSIPDDNYGIRWTGFIEPMFTADYIFIAATDDGCRLWIDNQPIIDYWVNKPGYEVYSTSIHLEGGKKYPITMEYFELAGFATAKLLWVTDGMTKAIVPSTQLFPSLPEFEEGDQADAFVQINPNPVVGNTLMLQTDMSHQEILKINVYDGNGRLILENTGEAISEPEQLIEVQLPPELDAGIYYLQVEGKKFTKYQTLKFFKS